MPVSAKMEVVGIKEALRDLQKVDKQLANRLKREARNILKPIVQDAQRNIPVEALTGMAGNWTSKKSGKKIFPWDGYTGRKYVKAKTTTKKPYEFGGVVRDLAVFSVSWSGGANMIFDMAGRQNNSLLATNLTGKFGPPSRIMWPAYEKNAEAVEAGISKVVDEIVDETNKQLGRQLR